MKISLLINGTPKGFFNISRGIRQGDPISPFLFIIMEKSFVRGIKKTQEELHIKGALASKGIPKITHQRFVDDTILSGGSSMEEGHNFKCTITTYMEASR